MSDIRILPVGDRAVLVEMGQAIDPALQAKVTALAQVLQAAAHPAITEWVPTYRSLLVHYDATQIDYADMATWLRQQAQSSASTAAVARRRVVIPVLYGGEMGPDLDNVAQHTQLAAEEVIRLHQEPDYLVYMLGFLPGFPYLGGLSPRLVTPRLATPRTQVPAGSVGIADQQTGIYPLTSPGGWQLIGRTPLRLYNPHSKQPFVLAAGDLLRFQAIEPAAYDEIQQQVAAGTYQLQVEEVAVDA